MVFNYSYFALVGSEEALKKIGMRFTGVGNTTQKRFLMK